MKEQRFVEALPAGYQMDRYRIEAVLGQGGFGITYCAQDLREARRIALKEYFPAASATRTQALRVRPRSGGLRDEFGYGLQRFRNEAEMLGRFQHANIVQVWRLLDLNDTAYIVMSFEEGETLARVLERWPRGLPEHDIVQLFRGVVNGLDLVHCTHHLHRDLAPDNIILRHDRSPVIIDFGAARCAYGQRTRSMEAIIKRGYSPPEQYLLDHRRQGPWTDVYALGAIAYRCIGGPTPPGALDRQGAAANGQPDPLLPAAVIGQGRYSPALLDAIDQALRLASQQRPESVAAWYGMFASATVAEGREAPAAPPRRSWLWMPLILRRFLGLGQDDGAGARCWILTGTDSHAAAINVTITEDDLYRAGGRLVIGRDEAQSQVTIADRTVSRLHAVLSLDEHGLLIEDAGSRNGTWVDGVPVAPMRQPVPVGSSARITLGGVHLVISVGHCDRTPQ